MKKQAVVSALIAVSAFVSVLSAKTPEEEYIETYRGRTGTPVPVKVVSPAVSTKFTGKRVDLVFVVDSHGRPGPMVSRSAAPKDLVETVAKAVSRWVFVPLKGADGAAKSAKVLLPVEVTEPNG
jgi:hypothetical protein